MYMSIFATDYSIARQINDLFLANRLLGFILGSVCIYSHHISEFFNCKSIATMFLSWLIRESPPRGIDGTLTQVITRDEQQRGKSHQISQEKIELCEETQ